MEFGKEGLHQLVKDELISEMLNLTLTQKKVVLENVVHDSSAKGSYGRW